MMPALFIAHGAPLLAMEDNEYTRFLHDLGRKLATPKAVVLFSAHWESNAQQVGSVDTYETIYDFYGFPEPLYRIQYPAKGDRLLAKNIEQLLDQQQIRYETDTNRGLDHGAWVVLRLLYPNADVPVISMSVNPKLPPAEQYKIGKTLAELRKQDVMIIGSGGTVHNLRALRMGYDNGQIDQWALDFDQWLEKHLKDWDTSSLFQYEALAPGAQMAVPPYGNEHFIPIFYAMGAADDQPQAALLHRSYRYGNLSHSVWKFGV